MRNLLITCILIISVSCAALRSKKNLPEDFYNCWSASYEEDREDSKIKTYRSCDYKFPPKMFRPTVKFNKDGTCQVLHVGPTDLHYYADCTWSYDKRKRRVVVIDKDKKVEMKFTIKSIEKDVMKIVQE